jgi:hypothetical protein
MHNVARVHTVVLACTLLLLQCTQPCSWRATAALGLHTAAHSVHTAASDVHILAPRGYTVSPRKHIAAPGVHTVPPQVHTLALRLIPIPLHPFHQPTLQGKKK